MNNERKKIFFIFVVFAALFFLLLCRAFQLQVINRKELIAYSESQTLRTSKVYPFRGNIYDRNGSPLAINIQTYSIFTIPKNVKGGIRYYKKLADIVPKLSFSKIKKKLFNRKRYTWLARKITLTKEQVERIKKLQGIYIESVPKRLYPNHELLSQTLGFTGIDNNGLAGLEYLFDKELSGKPKITKYIQDAKGRALKFESQEIGGDAQNLRLTIDKDLQSVAEKFLKLAVKKYKAVGGGIGIMNPETGGILAVANYPTYDANKLHLSTPKNRKLAFVSDPLEPGSVFKALTVVSALENKIIRPDTNYYCEKGKLKIDNHIIGEAEQNKHYEWLSVNEIMKYSSNIGVTKIAFDLTFPVFDETLRKFHIGRKTGIELPGESRGIYNFGKNVSPLSLSNISFGQGLATTGIQMLAAYSSIANGGKYVRPTIFLDQEQNNKGKRIFSKDTASELVKMLVSVVEEGTGSNARIPSFVMAGKTSTAQRPASNGGYDGYIPGFIGFPVNVKNKFVIYVYVDGPKGASYYGNTVAAPVFREVAKYVLYKNKEFSNMVKYAKEKDLNYLDFVKTSKSSTRTNGPDVLPNFIGLDKISAWNIFSKLNFKVRHKGIGIVRRQHPKPGQRINDKTVVTLYYEPPEYE